MGGVHNRDTACTFEEKKAKRLNHLRNVAVLVSSEAHKMGCLALLPGPVVLRTYSRTRLEQPVRLVVVKVALVPAPMSGAGGMKRQGGCALRKAN